MNVLPTPSLRATKRNAAISPLLSRKTVRLLQLRLAKTAARGAMGEVGYDPLSLRLDQMSAKREPDQRSAADDVKFLTDPRGMVFDGPNG